MDERDETVRDELYDACVQFIADNQITCPEAVYQSDRVIENAYEFIEQIANLVGYCEYEE